MFLQPYNPIRDIHFSKKKKKTVLLAVAYLVAIAT